MVWGGVDAPRPGRYNRGRSPGGERPTPGGGKAHSMADDAPTLPVYEVPWIRLFPWLRLFRAPGAAADPKRLMLAALGLLLLHQGWAALDRAFPGTGHVTPEVLGSWEPLATWPVRPGAVADALAAPFRSVAAPFVSLFTPGRGLRATTHAVLAGVWTLAVWGLVGGAIARVAAVDVTMGERVGLFESLRFAVRKTGSLLGTPLLPGVGLSLVAAGLAAFGVLYRVPGGFGPTAAGALAFLPLLGGLVLALVLLGLAAGWPLMHAAVAVEAEDAFDAMSRSYAYPRQRPWLYLFYGAVALAAGSVGLLFVDLFARAVVALAVWGLSLGAPADTVATLFGEGRATVPPAASAAHTFWLGAVGLLVRAWSYSYFWTAATTAYLLLRREVDGTPFHVVAYQGRPGPIAEAAAAPAAPAPVTPG